MASPKSADRASWAHSSAKEWRRLGGLTWNSLIPVGDTWRVRVLIPFMSTSIVRPAFLELCLFSTDPSLVRVQVYRCLHPLLRYCLTLLLKLDLQFELHSLLVPYCFVVLLFGLALALL